MAGDQHSPLDQLLERMQADVHTKKRDLLARVTPLEQAVQTYRLALESALARDLAGSHSLPRPPSATLTPEVAAQRLLDLVSALPELTAAPAPQSPGQRKTLVGPRSPAPRAEPSGNEAASPRSAPFPRLVQASSGRKLVLIGALSGRRKKLPEPFDTIVEWIDTGQGTANAIGNLATRIRQGRVSALVLCDQAISHKHSEPLVAAARAAHVPVAFAGKGGAQSILRAFQAIEDQL